MRRRDLSKLIVAGGAGLVTRTSQAQTVGAAGHARTAAEQKAAVAPADPGYQPGDLRRYGAAPGGDITAALASAASQANQQNGAAIYIPSALGICRVTSGVTFERPVSVYGEDYQNTVITATSDITVFTFNGKCRA